MAKELFMLADKIKALREHSGMTQAELARRLGLTRSSINGWEMGLSVPSTSAIVEIAKIFHVTTDYLLGMENAHVLRADSLSEKEIGILASLITCIQESKNKSENGPSEGL